MPTTIRLNWTAAPASEFVSKYEVFQSKDNGSFTKAGETVGTSFDVLNPLPGNYRFQVRAVNFVGNGPFSDIVAGPNVPTVVADVSLSVINS